MAARQITVTPDEVVRTARSIDADVVRYTESYLNVYRASDEMRAHWAGRDNVEYSNRLNAYQETLREMERLMREYVSYLDRSASDYRVTQDTIVGSAQQLPA